VGDISGNGRINAGDASLVARSAALIDVPQIPSIPAGVNVAELVARGVVVIQLGSRDPERNGDDQAFSAAAAAQLLIRASHLPYLAVDRVMADLNGPKASEDALQISLDDAVGELQRAVSFAD
jgi:hypothetical protein